MPVRMIGLPSRGTSSTQTLTARIRRHKPGQTANKTLASETVTAEALTSGTLAAGLGLQPHEPAVDAGTEVRSSLTPVHQLDGQRAGTLRRTPPRCLDLFRNGIRQQGYVDNGVTGQRIAQGLSGPLGFIIQLMRDRCPKPDLTHVVILRDRCKQFARGRVTLPQLRHSLHQDCIGVGWRSRGHAVGQLDLDRAVSGHGSRCPIASGCTWHPGIAHH
jgi:hypothetical protein